MNGTLQLRIGDPQSRDVLALDFDHVFVEPVKGGLEVRNRDTKQRAILWDAEITAVVRIGGGPTVLSALMLHALIDGKFAPDN